jgi:hypothetical protein
VKDQRTDWLEESKSGFRRLYYFTSPDHVLENLEKGIVKLSTFEACNDLFELSAFDNNSKDIRRHHKEWRKKVDGQIAFLCLSERWWNPLMWGYYGDRGRGMCLVLDVQNEMSHKVTYVRSKQPLRDFPAVGAAEFFTFCSTKSSRWKHEAEVRHFVKTDLQSVIKTDEEFLFHTLGDRISLAGVINGPHAMHGRSDVLARVGSTTNYIQVRAGFQHFRMRLMKNENLWVK